MSGTPIHIALTFDDNFWAPAYATMRSVALASERRNDLVFHLFFRCLTATHRTALDAVRTEFGVNLVDHDLTANTDFISFLAGMSFHPKLTNLVYARLMLHELLPADIARVIYLDCDMMVRAPIEALYDTDLQGNAIAAVLDPHRHRAMLGRDFRRNADLFDFRTPYFNAGMLLIDRKAYGDANLPERTRAYHEQGVLTRIQYDQAILNLVFKDNWLPLDFRWNLTNPQPAHENLEPKIVHYSGPHKPWSLFSSAAFARDYRHTMTNAYFYQFMRERWLRPLHAPFRKLFGGGR